MSDFEKMLRDMFSSIWDCEIDHPLWQDTVGEIMTAVIQAHEKCMPELTDEQVIDYCKKKGYKIVADDLFNLLSKPETHEGEWIPVQRHEGDAQPNLECPFCKHRIGWFDMGRYCAGCGAKLKGGAG